VAVFTACAIISASVPECSGAGTGTIGAAAGSGAATGSGVTVALLVTAVLRRFCAAFRFALRAAAFLAPGFAVLPAVCGTGPPTAAGTGGAGF